MGSFRRKMLFGLIAYFGGFATAIYYLAPASADASTGRKTKWKQSAKQTADTLVNTDYKAKAEQFKERMQTAIAYAEEKAQQVVELYKAHAAAAEKDKNLGADDEQ